MVFGLEKNDVKHKFDCDYDVCAMALSLDHSRLASASRQEKTIQLLDPDNKQKLGVLGCDDDCFLGVNSNWDRLAFSPDCKQLVSTTGPIVVVWDTSTGEDKRILPCHALRINAMAFSQDSRLLALASQDKLVSIWDMLSGERLCTLEGHNAPVCAVAFSSDIKLLASGSDDGVISIWDMANRELLHMHLGHDYDIRALVFSQDERVLASASDDRTVRLWDVDDGEELAEPINVRRFSTVALSSNAQKLAAMAKDGRIEVWVLDKISH